MDRSVLVGIGVSVALAAGCAGMAAVPPAHRPGSGGAHAGASMSGRPVVLLRYVSPRSPRNLPSVGQPSVSRPSARQGHVFVGVAVKGGIVSGVRSFSRASGARIAMVEIYTRFGAPFPHSVLHRVASTGAKPLMQWNPRGSSLARIAVGRYDAYLRGYAVSMKRFGHQVVLSFGHEMNGTWYSWGAGQVRPSTFVSAWRRIHDVFARVGVHNVTWSWDPSHAGAPPRPWWPGPGYVDQIGIDGYQRPGQTFAHIFADRLAYLRRFTSKPVYIAETSVAPSSNQARQINGLFNGVRRFHLSGFVWFDIDRLKAWRLEGRPAAIRAFRRALARVNR